MVKLLTVGLILPVWPRLGAVIEFVIGSQKVAIARDSGQ
jgi:hypothetical protein